MLATSNEVINPLLTPQIRFYFVFCLKVKLKERFILYLPCTNWFGIR